MIVCICNNVSERKIREAVEAGATSMSELREQLGVASCCGKCFLHAKATMRSCLEESDQGSERPLVFQPALAA